MGFKTGIRSLSKRAKVAARPASMMEDLESRLLMTVVAPDLTATLGTGDMRVDPGTKVSVPVTIANGGAAAAGAFRAALYESTDSSVPAVSGNSMAVKTYAALGAGGSSAVTMSFTAPSTPGVYYLKVVADSANAVAESNETNNASSIIKLTVGVAAPTKTTIIATGADVGSAPVVTVFDSATGVEKFHFTAYLPSFTGGIHVATADFTGDGVPDIVTAPGPGGGSVIQVWNGTNGALISSFFSYGTSFTGGVNVAAADVDGDGQPEIVSVPENNGGPLVFVWSLYGTAKSVFWAYDVNFGGGVRLATGDVDGDGKAEIITIPAHNGPPLLLTFNGSGSMKSAWYWDNASNLSGGFLAAGDLNGDGKAEVVISNQSGSTPVVRVFNMSTPQLISQFYAFDTAFTGGVRIAVADTDGDGHAEIVATPGTGSSPLVQVYNYTGSLKRNFYGIATHSPKGLFVAAV